MTTITLTQPTFREARPANPVARSFVKLVRRVARWQKIRSDRRLLQSMSDSLLSDIGISRSEIDHATQFGRDRL